MGVTVKNYFEQAGSNNDNKLVLDGNVKINNANLIKSITFVPAAGGANVCEVTISLKDALSALLTVKNYNLEVWLSDAATGLGLTGTTASGTVQAKSGEGTDLTDLTSKKHKIVQTKNAAGTYILEITDTAKTGFYVCCKNPITGAIEVSAQLVTGNYGS